MKKLIITCVVMSGLILSSVMSANAQLFRVYKQEDATIRYYQLPIENIFAQQAHFKIIESQDKARKMVGKAGEFLGKKLGKNVGKAIESASNAVLKDDTRESFYIDLFPEIFYHNNDNLGVNVYFSRGFSPMATQRGEKYHFTWEVDVKIIAYYKGEKIWSQDWKQIDGKAETSYNPGKNQASYTNFLKQKAYYYARRKIYNRYGLREERVTLPAFYTKKLDREYKNIMKDFAETIEKFSAKGLTKDVQRELEGYIKKWEKPLEDFQKGTSRKEARQEARDDGGPKIFDKNAWTLYYNLGVAHALLQNTEEAKKNVAEAIDLRRIKPKEIKNKDGEVKGSFTLGDEHGVVQTYLQDLEIFAPDYLDGIDAQDPDFARMFRTERNLHQVSNLAASYMFSDFYSKKFELGIFYNFFPINLKGDVKKIDGTITKNNKDVAHWKYRATLEFLLGKRTKIYTADKKTRSVNIKGSGTNMRTSRTIFETKAESIWGLTNKAKFDWTLKGFHNPSSYGYYSTKYAWNSDILLKGKFWNGNWFSIFKSDVPTSVKQTSDLRIKHNENYRITKIEGGKDLTKIKYHWPEHTNTYDKKAIDYSKEFKDFNDKGDPTKVIENGTEYEVSYTYDDQGNWTEMQYGDYVIRRTIAY